MNFIESAVNHYGTYMRGHQHLDPDFNSIFKDLIRSGKSTYFISNDIEFLAINILEICSKKKYKQIVLNFFTTLIEYSHKDKKKYLTLAWDLIKNSREKYYRFVLGGMFYSAPVLIETVKSLHEISLKYKNFPISQDLDQRLQSIILEDLLSSGKTEDLDIAYLVLDILKICSDKKLERTVSIFLTTLLEYSCEDKKKYLTLTLELIKNVGETILINCVSTRKDKYYTAQVLIEIVESLHTIYRKHVHFPISKMPCYDEGGKELIAQFINGPLQVIPTLQKKPTLQAKAPSKLCELLNNCFSFKEMKSSAIQYLSSLPDKNRSAMNSYLKFFNLLKDDHDKKLLNISDVKSIILLVIVTTSRPNSLIHQHSFTDLNELLEDAKTLCEQWGSEMLQSLCESKDFQEKASFNHLIRLLKSFNTHGSDLDFQKKVYENLENFKNGIINLDRFLEQLEDQIADSSIDFNKEADLVDVLEKFKKDVDFPLSDGNLKTIGKQYETVQKYCFEWQNERLAQLVNRASEIHEKAKKSQISPDEILQLIAIGRLALRIKRSKYLYNTQILALLGLLIFQKGSIAQIKTGEGKSLIVALLAFVLSMQKSRVHIVSSSHQLARRDEKETADFFKTFGMITSNICDYKPPAKCFQRDIVYGTASDFQFGILREMQDGETLFPERLDQSKSDQRFGAVIIDEVDNLTIDTASHAARQSFPAEISYNWVYYPIFQFVKTNGNASNVDQLRIFLQNYMEGKFSVPLKQLSDSQLKNWISYAYRALFIEMEKESYKIVQEKNQEGRFVDKIEIVDAETGRSTHGMRWSGGLHEFVEIKHGIEVEQETLTPLSISNSIFYQMHQSCYGLTGTIGLTAERESIKEIYDMDSFDVPPHKRNQRVDASPVIFPSNEMQFQEVLKSVKACRANGRPILIICKTIKESEIFEAQLKKEKIPFEMINEMQTKDEDEIIENAGTPGAVTIATNVAGRGTDIKLKEDSILNGGLHVILTFYPDSERVEDQAKGRAGRQGQCGSSEMILSVEKLDIPLKYLLNNEEILDSLLYQRQSRADLMKQSHSCRSQITRYIFSLASDFYRQLANFHQLLEDHKFLEERSTALSTLFFTLKKDQNFSHLNSKDRQIAIDAFNLLTAGSGSVSYWRNLLKQSINRIKNKMIAEFAIYFYQPIEELVNRSNFNKDISTKEMMNLMQGNAEDSTTSEPFKDILNKIHLAIQETTKQKLENLLKNITEQFEKRKLEWNYYLDSSGNGVMLYLGEITGLNLTSIGNSNYVAEKKKPANVELPKFKSDQEFDTERAKSELDALIASQKAAYSLYRASFREVYDEIRPKCDEFFKDGGIATSDKWMKIPPSHDRKNFIPKIGMIVSEILKGKNVYLASTFKTDGFYYKRLLSKLSLLKDGLSLYKKVRDIDQEILKKQAEIKSLENGINYQIKPIIQPSVKAFCPTEKVIPLKKMEPLLKSPIQPEKPPILASKNPSEVNAYLEAQIKSHPNHRATYENITLRKGLEMINREFTFKTIGGEGDCMYLGIALGLLNYVKANPSSNGKILKAINSQDLFNDIINSSNITDLEVLSNKLVWPLRCLAEAENDLPGGEEHYSKLEECLQIKINVIDVLVTGQCEVMTELAGNKKRKLDPADIYLLYVCSPDGTKGHYDLAIKK